MQHAYTARRSQTARPTRLAERCQRATAPARSPAENAQLRCAAQSECNDEHIFPHWWVSPRTHFQGRARNESPKRAAQNKRKNANVRAASDRQAMRTHQHYKMCGVCPPTRCKLKKNVTKNAHSQRAQHPGLPEVDREVGEVPCSDKGAGDERPKQPHGEQEVEEASHSDEGEGQVHPWQNAR